MSNYKGFRMVEVSRSINGNVQSKALTRWMTREDDASASEFANATKDDFQRELAEIETESMGWTLLESGVYLRVSDANTAEVLVVGMAHADMQASNVLWVV
jgi:hypothetical protein